jgi:cytochrome c553
MSAEPESRGVDPVRRLAAGITMVITAAALFGFIVLPLAQPDVATIGPLTAICRAVGLRPVTSTTALPAESRAPPTVSQVAWNKSTVATIFAGDRQKGREVAQQCTACHGEHGIVAETQAPDLGPAGIPNLAQLNRAALFKELSDYRSGSRRSDIMAPIAQSLSDRDVIDVIAYFAAPSASEVGSLIDWSTPNGGIGALVEQGLPGRRIPPCASCHGMGLGGPIGTPALAGQRAAYLEQELKLFKTGERGNDIYGAMREIAERLTDAEIVAAAKYYAAMQ